MILKCGFFFVVFHEDDTHGRLRKFHDPSGGTVPGFMIRIQAVIINEPEGAILINSGLSRKPFRIVLLATPGHSLEGPSGNPF